MRSPRRSASSPTASAAGRCCSPASRAGGEPRRARLSRIDRAGLRRRGALRAASGLTQGVLSALVADLAPADLRGTAFGVFHLVSGIAMVGTLAAGVVWDAWSSSAMFWSPRLSLSPASPARRLPTGNVMRSWAERYRGNCRRQPRKKPTSQSLHPGFSPGGICWSPAAAPASASPPPANSPPWARGSRSPRGQRVQAWLAWRNELCNSACRCADAGDTRRGAGDAVRRSGGAPCLLISWANNAGEIGAAPASASCCATISISSAPGRRAWSRQAVPRPQRAPDREHRVLRYRGMPPMSPPPTR